MKPIITQTDYNTLMSILDNLQPEQITKETSLLRDELQRAEKVKDTEIDADIIRLNSLFRFIDTVSGKEQQFMLTLPRKASLAEKKISILSPLGVALIGFREGMTIDWILPGGPRKIRILKVKNLSGVELIN